MKITAKTKLFGFFGHPSSHSRSPIIMNTAFEKKNINAVYLAFDVKKENLKQAIFGAKNMGMTGLSISIPHKIEVMKYCDEVDEIAKKIGAVNTLFFKNNKIYAKNTDWIGIKNAIDEKIKIDENWTGKILGAGGTARVAVFVLKKMGVKKITIFNRTLENAKKLAMEFGLGFDKIENFYGGKNDVIINTTPVGTNSDLSPIAKEKIFEKSVVFDVVYSPRKTKLLSFAKEKNCICVSGLKMLFFQGVEQFEFWTNKIAPKKEIWEKLR